MSKIFKWMLLASGIGILVFFCYWIYAIISFGRMFSTPYSKQDLIKNYETRGSEIFEVKNYLKKIVSKGKSVHVEFEGKSKLNIFHITYNGNNDYIGM